MAIQTTEVVNSDTTVYTSSDNSAITYAAFTNYTSSTISIDIHVVPSGDSVGNVNCITKSLEITATDTYQLYAGGEKLLLGNNDFISAVANVATGVNSVISYTGI
jgi:hypothetical protein